VQAAWLLRAVSCIDLTTLSGDDTPANTARLALKAARPVRMDLLQVRENLNLVIRLFIMPISV
jgi:deoxyribose-phosphate aldolase